MSRTQSGCSLLFYTCSVSAALVFFLGLAGLSKCSWPHGRTVAGRILSGKWWKSEPVERASVSKGYPGSERHLWEWTEVTFLMIKSTFDRLPGEKRVPGLSLRSASSLSRYLCSLWDKWKYTPALYHQPLPGWLARFSAGLDMSPTAEISISEQKWRLIPTVSKLFTCLVEIHVTPSIHLCFVPSGFTRSLLGPFPGHTPKDCGFDYVCFHFIIIKDRWLVHHCCWGQCLWKAAPFTLTLTPGGSFQS